MYSVKVSLSGPAYSFLLLETAKCEFGQEGFLLGSICQERTQSITDNEQQQIHISKIIRVNAVMPCPVLGYFYNGIGKVDGNKIKSFLGSKVSQVVAWYRFSTLPMFKVTLRERTIHTELANFFNIPLDLFSICILIKTLEDGNYAHEDGNNAHLFQQSFFRLEHFRYEPLQLHVMNLQDKKNSYQRYQYTSPTFQSLLDNLDICPRTSQGVSYITSLQNRVQDHLQVLVKELSVEEGKLFTLEQEVKQLLADRRARECQLIIIESDEEMDDDSMEPPCGILPFVNRAGGSAQKMDF